ncbi:hypothetical protein PRZ48_011435 [Zasmidium cellare]|uniref:Uncharacterized protein n=1 Tax=Zasmidium cellare TaxID=395010 RepID=A0ABR0E6Z4_ZASCE|nr:hypothetical protein PRZ48_011435 [Zasmidium cellare]
MASPNPPGGASTMDAEQAKHQPNSQPPPTSSDNKPNDNKECAFLRLPAEIRLRIYEYVLLPEPTVKIPCPTVHARGLPFKIQPSTPDSETKGELLRPDDVKWGDCSSTGDSAALEKNSRPNIVDCRGLATLVEGRLVGSTCELKVSAITDIQEISSVGMVTARSSANAIFATSRQIFNEAVPVLYERCRVCVSVWWTQFSGDQYTFADIGVVRCLPPYALQHIQSLHLEVDNGSAALPNSILRQPWVITTYLPSIRTISFHIDIDLVFGQPIDPSVFEMFYVISGQVEFFSFDVHIERDWDGKEIGWEEPVEIHDVEEHMVDQYNLKAEEIRDQLVDSLSEIFSAHGVVLRIGER